MKNYSDSPYVEKLFIKRGNTNQETNKKNENIFNFKSEIADLSFTYEDILEKTREIELKKKNKKKSEELNLAQIYPQKIRKKSSSLEIKDINPNSNMSFKKFSLSRQDLLIS